MTKKIIKMTICVLLIIASICMFTACSDEGGTSDNVNSNSNNESDNNIENGVEIGDVVEQDGIDYKKTSLGYILKECKIKSQNEITIPEQVKGEVVYYVGASGFKGIDNTIIRLPKTINEINYRAFRECNNCKFFIPDYAECNEEAFYECKNSRIYVYDTPDVSGGYHHPNWRGDTPYAYDYDEQDHVYNLNTKIEGEIRVITSNDFIELPILEKKGYVFLGWYTTPSCEDNRKIIDSLYYNNQGGSLYAKWISIDDYYDGSSFERPCFLFLNDPLEVNVKKNESKYLMFIPRETRRYKLYSDCRSSIYSILCNPEAYLYDEYKQLLKSDQDSGKDYDFSISYTLEKDQIYYLRVGHESDQTDPIYVYFTYA